MADKNKSSLKTAYLIAYNLVSVVGWAYILTSTIGTILTWNRLNDVFTSKNLYKNTQFTLKLFLVLPFVEIFHAVFKLVPSNPLIVFVQVLFRFLVIWGITDHFTSASESIAVVLLNLTWSVSEITRYLYYVCYLVNKLPPFLTWCRYNFFILLYPIGSTAEMLAIAMAAYWIQMTKKRSQYAYNLPNNFNISFDLFTFLCIWLVIYLPGFPVMYQHMLAQRRKVMASSSKSKSQ